MKSPIRSLACHLAVCLQITVSSAGAQQYPFQDPRLTAEQRIDNLLSMLTLDEKIRCLSSNTNVPRLGIRGTRHVEGLHGLARVGPSNWGQQDPVTTTIFPQAIGLAESWDPELLKRVGEIEGYEARFMFQSEKYRKGGLIIRAPNADIGRDPRWGRTEECYGEDAWFNGTMVVAFVKGLQGDHPTYWQTASLMKHFLANSNEDGRTSSSSNFDARLFREYYSLPFRMGVVDGGSRAFMTAYNAYNGIPCIVHPVLKDVTIKEWKQDGIICTDGGAFTQLVTEHRYCPDSSVAAAACLRAGITEFLDRYQGGVAAALSRHLITESTIDSALRGNFRVIIKLGLLDPPELVPYSAIGVRDSMEPWLSERHKTAAREVTQKTIVLLKNSTQLLPLDRTKVKSIAVIGSLADEVRLDWYSGTPPYAVTPLAGIRARVGENVTVQYARDNADGAAVQIARKAEVAIVCVGNHPICIGSPWGECSTPSDGREAVDRKSIILEQEELIKEVYQANPNTIVVLISSFPFAINWTQDHVPSIVHMTHSSQELGNALADALYGDVNPGGRLVQSWPKSTKQLPAIMDYDIRNGRTYMYITEDPLYPFGFGLSYTTFSYSNLRFSSPRLKPDGEIIVSVDVRNTGRLAGDEVVQMYIQHHGSGVERPNRELRGFRRITLKPDESMAVDIPLQAQMLAFWDENARRFVVETGSILVMVGSSSADIRAQKTLDVVE
jgi:beta-glucosidase